MWDRGKVTWGGRGECIGTVPMGASVRECRVMEKGFWRENGLGTVGVVMGNIESKLPYTSWVLLKSGKHRNSKRGLARSCNRVEIGLQIEFLVLSEIYLVKVRLDQLKLKKANRLIQLELEELL
nr:hypothetical protein [Tanacetum cinerariifolium]